MRLSQVKRKLTVYYAATLFSIFFAIVGFSYNAWRLEQSEFNASARESAFLMLSTLAEFEQVVFASYYDEDNERGNPRVGWGKVILMEDLASMMSELVRRESASLKSTWQDNWQTLPHSEGSLVAIENSIKLLRQAIKSDLTALD